MENSKMVLASTNVLVVEYATQNGCQQHLCAQGESQLPSASLGDSPRWASGSDPGSFQFTVCWVSKCVRLRMHSLRVESLFLQPSCSPTIEAALAFKAGCSGGSSSQCSTPRLERPMRGLDPLLHEENLCNCDYPPVFWSLIRQCGSWLYHILQPSCHLIVVLLLCL